jgi:hypothetical protein
VFLCCKQRMRPVSDRVEVGGGHGPKDNFEGVSRREGIPPMLGSVLHSGAPFGFCRETGGC